MIELKDVTKTYGSGSTAYHALSGVNLSVAAGEIAAVVGPSGAGKSTLARCINLLTPPTSGSVSVNGEELTRLDARRLRTARQAIGTVFQGSNLLARRTAAQNIALPLEYLGVTPAAVESRVAELLDLVGLAERGNAYPSQLSGGQRQRVGIARALALRPSVLLADEATSGLDPDTTTAILDLIRDIRDAEGLSVVLITHEMDVVRAVADSVARLAQGRIVEAGAVVDIVSNPLSPLAEQLLPARPALRIPDGQQEWHVLYNAQDVAPDWVLRLSTALGSPVGLLSASIEAVGAGGVGRVSIGVRDTLPIEQVLRSLTALGLHGSPQSARHGDHGDVNDGGAHRAHGGPHTHGNVHLGADSGDASATRSVLAGAGVDAQ